LLPKLSGEFDLAFKRPKHNLIAEALRSMNADLLVGSKCYFGGGTAIVLHNGEYRLSLDVDFLCADIEGYRTLREAFDNRNMAASAVFGGAVKPLRDFVSDQYGIRGFVSLHDHPIKFEVVREARIPLSGSMSELGVPMLSIESQFAEKLLAAADRSHDKGVARRDAIDLGYLLKHHGGAFPPGAIAQAERAYGGGILKGVVSSLNYLAKPNEIAFVADRLKMDEADVLEAAATLRYAAAKVWTTAVLPDLPTHAPLPR
jgi:hypothetical protein